MTMTNKDQKPHGGKRPDLAAARAVKVTIAGTLDRFTVWRHRTSVLTAALARTDTDKRAALDECRSIRAQVSDARTDLILGLAKAPQNIASHSRVADVEKALDDLEASLKQLERRARA